MKLKDCPLNIDRFRLYALMVAAAASIGGLPTGYADEQAATVDSAQEEVSIGRLIAQLGADSYAQRRVAFNQILRLGTAAQAEVDVAATSTNRQVAESAKQLKTLIKVVAKCQDPQIALEVADYFLEANEQNLVKLTERGLWDLAELFLDEHSTVEIRCQEKFYRDLSTWYLIQQMVGHADQQGNVDAAWPIISRLVPNELAYWTANKLQLPLHKQPEDAHERALSLLIAGKVDEALEQNVAPQLWARLALRGFRWNQFADQQLRDALIGAPDSAGAKAAGALVVDIAGDRTASDELWRQALAIDSDVPAFSEQESQAAFEALLREAPLDTSATEGEDTSVLKPAAFHQLVVALILSGRTEPVERYLVQQSPQAAFAFAARDNYSRAFKHLGLQPDLSNFDQWLNEQKTLARDRLSEFERSSSPRLSLLMPAVNLGHLASILASVGKREQAIEILTELINLSRKFRGESDVWNRCILRWLNGDQWRETCIEVISSRFETIPKDQQSLALEKLFPALGTNALALLLESPSVKNAGQSPSWPEAFEQLVHLARCDREYFGPSAAALVRSWIHRVAQQGQRQLPNEEEFEYSFAKNSSWLGLAKLANDWEDTGTALELLGLHGENPNADFDQYLLAAQIYLKSNHFDTALECMDAVPAGPRDQHWRRMVRTDALLSSGKIGQAEQQIRSQWMRMSSLYWNGDQFAGHRVVDDFIDAQRWDEALEYAERNFVIDRTMNYHSFWQARQYAAILQELEQFGKSADVMRSVFLELLRPNSVVVRYFSANNDLDLIRYTATRERLSRAISLIENGKFDDARRELDVAYRLHSQDIESVVSCYPLLVKAGQTEFAMQLFSQFESELKEQIRQWPKDAMSLNNLAWMYARCNVKLDEALDLSRQAVKLVPNSAVYLDTLAEIQYRRQDVDQAIETMRDCVRIDPRTKGYRKNLIRFSTGQP